MVQKKAQKKTGNTEKKKSETDSVKKNASAPKTVKASQKKTSDVNASKAIQVVEPKPLPVVIPTQTEKKKQLKKTIAMIVLSLITVVLWFFVGQKALLLVSEEIWMARHSSKNIVQPVVDEVVATVNGTDIYLSDVRLFAEAIPQLAELPFEVVYPQLLETMVNSKVLLTAAEQAGTEKIPSVAKAVKSSRDQIVSQAYLTQKLESSVTPEQMQALYQQEADDFTPVEEIRARHILVKTQKEAQDVIIRLKAGADFEMLANKYSLDKSSPNGELGYFTEEMMIPEFGRAVFKLKVGQISDVIKTPFGFHIVEVEDKRMSQAPTYEEIKDQLRQLAMEQNLPQVMAEERQQFDVVIKMPKLIKK